MPCPRGFKHAIKHPRPNRRKAETGKCLPLTQVSQAQEDTSWEDDFILFTNSDLGWLQTVGIRM